MTLRPHIAHVETGNGNDEVSQHLQGDQGEVGGPEVLLLGYGNEIKSPNWVGMWGL